jgi:hypothetical protein
MNPKDYFEVVFRYYSIDKNGEIRLRDLTGFMIYRRRQRRKNDWEKRNGIR